MKRIRVLIPLPSYGFDPTEVAIPWELLTKEGFEVVFATPEKRVAEGDRIMLTGKGLGVFGRILKARKDAVNAYEKMKNSPEFNNPIRYEDIKEQDFDSLFLPGGHDKGVKEYLESDVLQQSVVRFFNVQKPVAAICHGVVLLARSIDSDTGKSVIFNYKTTSLLKSQELLAYKLTKLWLKDYYLTYPEITVEDEVRTALSSPSNFVQGPPPMLRDDPNHLNRGFFVRDRNYISARWPGDVYKFSFEFINLLRERE